MMMMICVYNIEAYKMSEV